jgi:hypothetical protein
MTPKPPKRHNPRRVECIPGTLKGDVYHFKNAAARRAAGDISDIRTARDMLEAVNSGRIPPHLVKKVPVNTLNYSEAPKRAPRKPWFLQAAE